MWVTDRLGYGMDCGFISLVLFGFHCVDKACFCSYFFPVMVEY